MRGIKLVVEASITSFFIIILVAFAAPLSNPGVIKIGEGKNTGARGLNF